MSTISNLSNNFALQINEINVNDKYEFIKKIGKGSYGEVWLVLPKTPSASKSQSRQQVLKRLDLRQASNDSTQNDIEVAEREAKLLSTLKHPNIVAYTESFRSKDGFLNIVMAFCEGGDLYTKLKEKKSKREALTENQIIEWFIQICLALQYIHERNILHRDLKTQNVFLTKNDIVKVGDLGIARVLDSARDLATTVIGTPYYMSPEILLNKPYGQKTDIWSLGCCVYEMITYEHPFNAKDMPALISKIISNETPQISQRYSQPLRDIIVSLLKKSPDERPTAKVLLQNSYIKQHILRLLEKTKTKCKIQANSNAQSIVNVSSRPVTAVNSSPSKSRLSNQNNNPSVLPTYHPVLPSSYSRPLAEPILSKDPAISQSRARRLQGRQVSTDEQEKNLDFISKVRHNDTLQRLRRNQQLNNHLKLHQQSSVSDEQDVLPIQPSQDHIPDPLIQISPPSYKQPRTSSVESNSISSRPSSQPRVTKSYDLNQGPISSARQRRRESKLRSSSIECATPTDSPSQTIVTTDYDLQQIKSQDNSTEELEKKKEGEKDASDLVFMLTATLQLPSLNAPGAIDNNRAWSLGDRTIASPLQETHHLHQLCNQIRQQCLQEISPTKLRRVLKIVENVSEAQMTQEMIDELGEDLFNKYSAQIFLLQFYENDLLIHL
ncbi:hypothetical protein I4U23_003060 [Adineta vaga]|nr:hypothetical protein I4U23_003060 [Adineta vaga]